MASLLHGNNILVLNKSTQLALLLPKLLRASQTCRGCIIKGLQAHSTSQQQPKLELVIVVIHSHGLDAILGALLEGAGGGLHRQLRCGAPEVWGGDIEPRGEGRLPILRSGPDSAPHRPGLFSLQHGQRASD